MSEQQQGRLERIARAIHRHQTVTALTADPDPAPKHDYERSPQSGAGNCKCGAAEHHRLHLHAFWASASDLRRCVCGLSEGARCHTHPTSPSAQCRGEGRGGAVSEGEE